LLGGIVRPAFVRSAFVVPGAPLGFDHRPVGCPDDLTDMMMGLILFAVYGADESMHAAPACCQCGAFIAQLPSGWSI
jgi:hypothetical protein